MITSLEILFAPWIFEFQGVPQLPDVFFFSIVPLRPPPQGEIYLGLFGL
jgi:hypothetical protein